MNALRITAFLVVVAFSTSSVLHTPENKDTFELLILHNNDMHARFEQTSQLSATCTTKDREMGKCYGGFPRVAHVVKEARQAAASGEGPPVLYLNAGDTYTGTAWFTIYKWKIAAEFLNAIKPDAVSLGNHEFDENVNGLIPFIRNLTTPTLAANLILDDVPELASEPNFKKSVILTVGTTKIGVIGYLTPQTIFLAPRNKVKYEAEVAAIRREVQILKKEKVNILIALGHSGYVEDLNIAKNVEDLDVVIGGHSNTFLWNSNTTEKPEIPEGMYPTIVTQASGRKVLVVQAYAFTKYMGQLHLVFNLMGEIIKFQGQPLLLDQHVPQDPELLAKVEEYSKKVGKIYNENVGESLVILNGTCRLSECNLGDLIADAILNYTKKYHPEYSNVNIAVIQGGRIRTSIDHTYKPIMITRGDVMTVLPFTDMLTIVTMNGTLLKQTLEHSVSTWRTVDSTGQFLQVSGINVTYDLARPPGSRVIDIKAVCSDCGHYELSEVKETYTYKIIMPLFLADGGDGYEFFVNLPKEIIPFNEIDSFINYTKQYSPVNVNTDGRIKIRHSKEITAQPRAAINKGSSTIPFLLTVFFSIIKLFL